MDFRTKMKKEKDFKYEEDPKRVILVNDKAQQEEVFKHRSCSLLKDGDVLVQ